MHHFSSFAVLSFDRFCVFSFFSCLKSWCFFPHHLKSWCFFPLLLYPLDLALRGFCLFSNQCKPILMIICFYFHCKIIESEKEIEKKVFNSDIEIDDDDIINDRTVGVMRHQKSKIAYKSKMFAFLMIICPHASNKYHFNTKYNSQDTNNNYH